MAKKTISIYGPIRIDPPIKPRKDDKEARKSTGTGKSKTTGKRSKDVGIGVQYGKR